MSSVPVNVTLPEEFWHFRVGALGFVIEYVVPESVVGIVTEPSQLPLPVPSGTCSLLPSSLPERAST